MTPQGVGSLSPLRKESAALLLLSLARRCGRLGKGAFAEPLWSLHVVTALAGCGCILVCPGHGVGTSPGRGAASSLESVPMGAARSLFTDGSHGRFASWGGGRIVLSGIKF